MAKITQAELEELRQAKNLLDALAKDVGASGSATEYATAITTTSGAFGGSNGLDGHGDDVARFIDARTEKIKAKLQLATRGVSDAVGLMSTTISNYEANEKRHADAANATPAGKSGASGTNGTNAPGRRGV